MYNLSLINYNKIMQKKFFYLKTDSAHAKRKRYNKKL